MSGHSKWATIKRKKGKTDAARGKTFSKLIKEITIAARMGGGDETANPRLRSAVSIAKSANMPGNNIDRAIKKGTGDLPGVTFEEITYEAYGPGGTALMIEVTTDNKNRSVGEIRHMLTKHGGNMGENGCVGWMFDRVGMITVVAEGIEEDDLMMITLDAGGDDLKLDEDIYQIITPPESLESVRLALEEAGIEVESYELARIPQTYVEAEGGTAKQILRLMDALDDHDDVLQVWSNFDIPEDMLEEE